MPDLYRKVRNSRKRVAAKIRKFRMKGKAERIYIESAELKARQQVGKSQKNRER